MRMLKYGSALAAALLLLSGCGGGGGSDSASVSPSVGDTSSGIGKAAYVDAAVDGVYYECGSRSGVTGENGNPGEFLFEKGKGCTFRIGDVTLRTLPPEDLVDGGVVMESDPKVAALLQSLDMDGDPGNGIEISEEIRRELRNRGVHAIPDTETELDEIVTALREKFPDLKPVSFAEAQAHVRETYARYVDEGSGHGIRLTDEDAFNQYATGPVLYNIPVMAEELSVEDYVLAPLTDEEFEALSEPEKYKVAIKLYGSLFYGVDTHDFLEAVSSGSFVSDTYALFNRETPPSEIAAVEEKVSKYARDDGYYRATKLMGTMLARLYEMEPGKAFVNRWAAYILTQTILFSPAYELDTVYNVDAIDVYGDLVRDFDAGFSMQWSTFTHMMSDENWRRFRSPEDNGREMLEIYNMDFNDAHVPLAAKALQNWKLERNSNSLVVDLNENTEPITDLFAGRTIFNGTDFYSAVVLNPAFVRTVSRRLVDIYFPDYDETQKEAVTEKLVASRPMRFTDILKQIVFSKEYLLHSHKTRSFEESFFQVAKTLGWVPKRKSFYYLAENLDRMHQSTMRYKLGRKTQVPLDSQSFAWYHKTMRENVLLNYSKNVSWKNDDDGWPFYEMFAQLPENLIDENEFNEDHRPQELWFVNEKRRAAYIINRLFVPLVGRVATQEEIDEIFALIDDSRYDDKLFKNIRWWDLYGNLDVNEDVTERSYFAQLVLNYVSRLSPIYEFEAVK